MKPNELTPEQAIERVEGGFHHACDWRPETEPGCGACPACLDNAALRLVIEAARESLEEAVDDTAALSFDEALRIVTRDMHWFRRQAHGNTNPAPLKRKQAAYKMVLEAAKRPTALSGEERKYFADKLSKVELSLQVAPTDGPLEKDLLKQKAYLTAALSLASPFTEKQLAAMKACIEWARDNADGEDMPSDLASAHAKLDAMLAQSAIEE